MNPISLSLPLDPNVAYPEWLSRVEWTMNVLAAEETRTADIPFTASDTWIEVTPGMEILVEKATVQQGAYQYRIQVKYDRTRVAYLMDALNQFWLSGAPPAAAVLKMDLLDAEGKSVHGLSGVSGGTSIFGGLNNQMTGTVTGSGSCSACGTVTTIRYTLAFSIHELEARLAVENVPVPEF